MLCGIDTSNWQGAYSVPSTCASFVIAKATEGTGFVDPFCDDVVQQCIGNGVLWGFYHFADARESAIANADYFIENCYGYFGSGIPVLDWEALYDSNSEVSNPSVEWVNEFVNRVHDRTGVWPWIYANPWRFNQGGVESNCARWLASYPEVASPTFVQASEWECPEADGNVVAWQFCSDGRIPGITGSVDLNVFYGTKEQWAAYASGDGKRSNDENEGESVLSNDDYTVTIRKRR